MKKLSVAAGSVLMSLLLSGCAATSPTPTPPPQPLAPTPEAQAQEKPMHKMEPKAPPALSDTQKIQLAAGEAAHVPANLTFDFHAGSFYFVPNMMKVKKGDTVTINVKNDGGTHDFTLDEFKVKIGPIRDGETKSATFVADKAGTFEYYCGIGSHRSMGQKGTLIVE